MIIKSKPRKTRSFDQLVGYLLSNGGRGASSIPFVITQNLIGQSGEEIVKELEANEDGVITIRKNAVRVIHEIISFHPKDSPFISKSVLKKIVTKYLELRSPNGMFIAVPHVEEDHVHVHICGSPWAVFSGPSLRMSRKEFKQLKCSIEQFQMNEFPELTYSQVRHGRGLNSLLDLSNRSPDLNYLKEQVYKTIEKCYSWIDMIKSLNDNNFEVYSRNGAPQGVLYRGRKYRFSRIGLNPKAEFVDVKKELESRILFNQGRTDRLENSRDTTSK